MKTHERGLIEVLALLTIVVSLSSVGSMYVYYMGTFENFVIPPILHQAIIIILAIASFVYLGIALYNYHTNK